MNIVKSLNKEKGFTIIETVVAQVVLVVGALCIWNGCKGKEGKKVVSSSKQTLPSLSK